MINKPVANISYLTVFACLKQLSCEMKSTLIFLYYITWEASGETMKISNFIYLMNLTTQSSIPRYDFNKLIDWLIQCNRDNWN